MLIIIIKALKCHWCGVGRGGWEEGGLIFLNLSLYLRGAFQGWV